MVLADSENIEMYMSFFSFRRDHHRSEKEWKHQSFCRFCDFQIREKRACGAGEQPGFMQGLHQLMTMFLH